MKPDLKFRSIAIIVIALRNSVVVAEIIRSRILVGAAFSRELEVGEPSPSGVAGRILICVESTSTIVAALLVICEFTRVSVGVAAEIEASACSAIVADLPAYLSGMDVTLNSTPDRSFVVTRRIAHDREAFTQGLVFHRGYLFESTGLRGRSSLRKIAVETGRIVDMRFMDSSLFAEGLTFLNGRLVQMTWQSQIELIYDTSLKTNGTLQYSGEAWGLAKLNGCILLSDGTSTLKVLEAGSFRPIEILNVTDHGRAVTGLNELETIEGLIFANVFPTDCIARIDPHSGRVVSWLNLAELFPLSQRKDASTVANGIAYDVENEKIFVTGKRWPYIFELKLLENHKSGAQFAGHTTFGVARRKPRPISQPGPFGDPSNFRN